MGEMADYAEDMWLGDEEYEPEHKVCKYCGEDELCWVEIDNGWRLMNFETGEIHNCKEYHKNNK